MLREWVFLLDVVSILNFGYSSADVYFSNGWITLLVAWLTHFVGQFSLWWLYIWQWRAANANMDAHGFVGRFGCGRLELVWGQS